MIRVSASQSEDWAGCPAKWAYRKIDGIPKVESESAARGTRVHNILEAGIRHYAAAPQDGDVSGFDFLAPDGELAGELLPLTPLPEIRKARHYFENVAEQEFSFDLPDRGITVQGKVDYLARFQDCIEIGDFKTTSDLKWAKVLAEDGQAGTYIEFVRRHYPSIPIRLRWLYVTTAKKTLPVLYSPPRERDAPNEPFERVLQHAGQMALAKLHFRSATEYPKRFDSCRSFGGCPYLETCNHSMLDEEKEIPMTFPATMIENGKVVRYADGRPLSTHTRDTQWVQNPHTGEMMQMDPLNPAVLDALQHDADRVARGELPPACAPLNAAPAAPPPPPPPPAAVAPPPPPMAPPPPPPGGAHAGDLNAAGETLLACVGRLGITALSVGLELYHASQRSPDGRPWAAIPVTEIGNVLQGMKAIAAAGKSPYDAHADAAPGASPVLPPEATAPPAPPTGDKKKGPGRPRKDAGGAPDVAPPPPAASVYVPTPGRSPVSPARVVEIAHELVDQYLAGGALGSGLPPAAVAAAQYLIAEAVRS